MATQTPTQRRARASRAAATRKRSSASQSAAATKSSARRTRASASATARNAERTTRQATRTTGRRAEVATHRLDELGQRAQRVFYIQVGAVAAAGDVVARGVRRYSNLDLVARELNRFERRGARAVGRGQRALTRRRERLSQDVRKRLA